MNEDFYLNRVNVSVELKQVYIIKKFFVTLKKNMSETNYTEMYKKKKIKAQFEIADVSSAEFNYSKSGYSVLLSPVQYCHSYLKNISRSRNQSKV